MALVRASLTSQVIKVTPILPEILTSGPYNCWPLLLRMSVIGTDKDELCKKIEFAFSRKRIPELDSEM